MDSVCNDASRDGCVGSFSGKPVAADSSYNSAGAVNVAASAEDSPSRPLCNFFVHVCAAELLCGPGAV